MDPFMGEIRRLAYQAIPDNWLPCDGRLMPIPQNTMLFSLIGTLYGGDGQTTFGLPDLRGRTPVHQHGTAGPMGAAGSGSGPEQRYLTVVYTICVQGSWPPRD